MASREMSTDSDLSSEAHYRTKRYNKGVSSKVENLAATLQDTNRNLRAMDRMLEDYHDLGDKQSTKIDRLHDDLLHTSDKLRQERSSTRDPYESRDNWPMRASDLDDQYSRGSQSRRHRRPTSPLRDPQRSVSDRENHGDGMYRGRSSAVRFYDDMDTHSMHQTLRDVTSSQLRVEDDVDKEIDRRNRWESQSRKSINEIQEALRKPDHVMSTVDKRLQNIQDELKSERILLKQKNEEVGQISQELKKALDHQKEAPLTALSEENQNLKSRLTQTEAQRNIIDELKKQLIRSDQDKQQMRSALEHSKHGEADREHQEQQRRLLESEVRELRGQLTKSAGVVGEYGQVRKHLDKSERQRLQLSDHIEVIQKDLEQKERQAAKVITQLQTLTEKHEVSERDKRHLQSQVEEMEGKLRTTTQESDSSGRELTDVRRQLQELESRKEEVKARAQETVRQWKVKVKKLERDLDRFKHSSEQASGRCEQLVRELEGTKSQGHTMAQQLDLVKREFSELLAIRAQQDEQVRLKDIEVNELKSLKMDLEKDLRDCKMVIERLEYELHSMREKTSGTLEEKNRLEDQLSLLENSHHVAQSQIQQFQRELQETSHVKVDLSSQLADTAKERQELKAGLSESRKAELAAREELDSSLRRSQEDKEFFRTRMEVMKKELDTIKSQEAQKIQEVARHYKKDRVENDAELHTVKMEVQEEKAANKLLKKQVEKMRQEVDRLNQELVRKAEDNEQFQQQYHHIREDFLTKSQITEDGLSRAKDVELELLDQRAAITRKERDFTNVLHRLAAEVDAVVEVATLDSVETYKALSMSKAVGIQACVQEITGKLAWLKSEFRQQLDQEKWMKTNMKDAVHNSERDRQFLISELQRQNEVLDQISGETRIDTGEKAERDVEEEQFRQNCLGCEEGRDGDPEVLIQETQKERERIHERFARLQETMSDLKQELTDTHLHQQPEQVPRTCLQRTPPGRNRHRKVSFHEPANHSPPRSRSPTSRSLTPPRSRSPANHSLTPPRSRSPANHSLSPPRHRSPANHSLTPPRSRSSAALSSAQTPPPLALSDEDFLGRFLPKTPPTLQQYKQHA